MKTISLRALLRRAWQLYQQHFWLFVLLTTLELLISPSYDDAHQGIHVVIGIISAFALLLLTFINAKITLLVVDEKEISWDRRDFFPTPHEYLKFLLLLLVMALLLIGGFVLLIIPGIYVMIRFYFAVYAYVGSGSANVSEAIKESWTLVRGRIFWKVLLWALVAIVLNIFGAIAFKIGLLITVPLTWLVTVLFFRTLQNQNKHAEIVVQPIEIPPTE